MAEKKDYSDQNLLIPSKVLQDRTISVLEAIVEFLKEQRKLNYHQIGVLLNRDERNIWTVYKRAKDKRNAKGKKNVQKNDE